MVNIRPASRIVDSNLARGNYYRAGASAEELRVALLLNPACPRCKHTVQGAFPVKCPSCEFSLSSIAAGGSTRWQQKKWGEHTDLLSGRQVSLHGKTHNASFDYKGVAKLEDLLRFTLTFGDRIELPSPRGNHNNPVIITYIPEPIGSGTNICNPSLVPCSGVCLISPQSSEWVHTFPVMDDWVQNKFASHTSSCRLCGHQTAFAHPICARCYTECNGDWMLYL